MKGQRSIQETYDYLFEFIYLATKYDLKIDQKDLSELSHGECFGLLLVFYLMLDRQDILWVIDQPEDNPGLPPQAGRFICLAGACSKV
ncbi:hypothetical protein DVJ77_03060 [Dyella tabacisoli]|uniref:Uncharacterized protein n=1 Tax=Dyella tabacisoli TaxID=2282381 RepID=A0A369USS6_9GAMM|nr:hypothetical protein DVJ77_03060 [Dyella tabacisoli]